MRPGGLTYQLVKPSHLGWQVGDYPVERKTVLDHGPHLTGLQIPVVVDKKKIQQNIRKMLLKFCNLEYQMLTTQKLTFLLHMFMGEKMASYLCCI